MNDMAQTDSSFRSSTKEEGICRPKMETRSAHHFKCQFQRKILTLRTCVLSHDCGKGVAQSGRWFNPVFRPRCTVGRERILLSGYLTRCSLRPTRCCVVHPRRAENRKHSHTFEAAARGRSSKSVDCDDLTNSGQKGRSTMVCTKIPGAVFQRNHGNRFPGGLELNAFLQV
jgi:hypothetical protein